MSLKSIVFFIAFSLFLINALSSQILNIEKYRMMSDTSKSFALNGRGSLNVNNRSAEATNPVNLFGYNLALNGLYIPKKHAYILLAQKDYLRINDSPFLNFGFIHGRVNFFRKSKINYELFAQTSHDNFRGLNPRILSGGYVRINLIDNKNTDFIFGFGGFYEFEKWQHPVNDSEVNVSFIKNSNYIVFRHSFSEQLHLNTIAYYQVGYDQNIGNFRHRYSGNIILNSKISKHFNFFNQFDFSYEDRPIVPITKFIFTYRVGVGIDF